MKRLIFTLFILLSLPMWAGNKPKDSNTTYAYDILKPYVESGKLPGSIVVLYRDGIQETCCIGYADVEAGRKITMDDFYMQCSQTKGFCGVTVAKLVEEGKVSLDDPVSKYLPEFGALWVKESQNDSTITLRKAKNVLTVRMVLNHTGGFPFEICAKTPNVRGGGWNGGAPLRQVASIAAASPLLFEPGTKVRYSNTGIDIAAAIVETVTGERWEDYLKREILDPLGMKNSTFYPTDKQLKKIVEMYKVSADAPAKYIRENSNMQRPYNNDRVFASAGAGLWTCASEQLKFYKMLMNLGVGENGVRVLKEETVKNLLAVSSRPEGMEGYSLGLTAPKVDGENEWFGHGGAWGTYCTVNWHKKELIFFVEQLNGDPRPWKAEILKAADKFFDEVVDQTSVEAYTGRTN